MHRLPFRPTHVVGEVQEKPVHIKRCQGRGEYGHRTEAAVQGLIGRHFVVGHAADPEPFPVETYIPVAQVIDHKILDGPRHLCRLVIVVAFLCKGDECVQPGDDPPVDLRTLFHGNQGRAMVKLVQIGIKGKNTIGVVQCAKEPSLQFRHPGQVKLKVIPWI